MELDYQITLTSVPFDNSYKNVLRFDTRSEQEAYFQTNTLFSNSPRVNFNVGSLYATNIVYDGAENESIGELLNKNYCIIKDNRENRKYDFYYYFVTNAIQDCDNRIKLSLELDIFQTYYIDLNFGDSVIYKAHLNRFIDNGDGTISFDGTETSKLFEREDIKNVSKRMTKRNVLSLYNNMGNVEIENWLKENVKGWLYIFYDKLTAYNIGDNSSTDMTYQQITNNGMQGAIPTNIRCVCVPIYKNADSHITFQNGETSVWWGGSSGTFADNNQVLQAIQHTNNGFEKIYSLKFSIKPPFIKIPNDLSYTISNNILKINCSVVDNSFQTNLVDRETYTAITTPEYIYPNIFRASSSQDVIGNYGRYCIVSIVNINDEFFCDYEIDKKFSFTKNEIIGSNKNPKFNPKLLNSDYCSLSISDTTEDGFEYDIQKLNLKNVKIQYTEPTIPDIAKKYIRISNTNGIYINECKNNLTGFINSNDNSLLLPTTAYQSMLANNKNYFIQNSINRNIGLAQGLLSSGLATAGGLSPSNNMSLISSPMAIAGGMMGALNSGLNYSKSIINENLTIDNLRNAPSKIVGAKGNVIFENIYSESGVVVEEFDILDNEKEMINDYMCLYGFTYNRVDNVKNVDNIRKFYNFVRADIETINGATISETVHQKFRQCFANGVRFWNIDTFNYNKENYERWLENE